MPEQEPALSAEQIAALRARVGRFSVKTYARGTTYYRQGRVLDVSYVDNVLSAFVLGNEEYGTAWMWDGSAWNSDCDCPIGVDCKHACALGLHVLANLATTAVTAVAVKPVAAPVDFAKTLRSEVNPWRRRDIVRRLLMRPPLHCVRN